MVDREQIKELLNCLGNDNVMNAVKISNFFGKLNIEMIKNKQYYIF